MNIMGINSISFDVWAICFAMKDTLISLYGSFCGKEYGGSP